MIFFEWITALFTLARGVFSLLLCLLLSLTLLFMSAEGKRIFYEVAVSTVLAPVESVIALKKDYFRVYQENEKLRRENISLKVTNDRLKEYQTQNQRLKSMLSFKNESGFDLMSGEIFSRNPGRYVTSWRINLGERDSIELNMPVLTAKGVVGKVAKVYWNHSLVQLIYDPNFKISVLNQRSRHIAILESYQKHEVSAQFSGDADVRVGDTLVTSGLGGVFPKGLMVGEVQSEFKLSNAITRKVKVNLFQDPHLVEEVFVYRIRDSWFVINP